jgi:hypothetical protein
MSNKEVEDYKRTVEANRPRPVSIERNSPPAWSDVMGKWNHPPGGRCTCGCNGGWSNSSDKL